jgi:AraC-like DNA-binding protein
MVESFVFSGRDLDEAQAFRLYQTLYSGGADVKRIDGPLVTEVRSWRLDRILMFDRIIGGVSHSRPAPRVRDDGFSHFTVSLVREGLLEGSRVSGFDRAEPGQIVLQDMRRPTQTTSSYVSLLTASVARDLIEAAAGSSVGLHGRVLGHREAGLLADYMLSLAARASALNADAGTSVSRVFVELLSLALNPTTGASRTAMAREDFSRRETLQRYIDGRLEDPQLSAATVVAATGISRATLYRVMEPHGGVARFIGARRIARVRALLDGPGEPTLAELADRFAFSSPSRLTRKFTEVLGLSPTAYRRMVRDPDQAIDALRQRWAAWMIEIR